MDLNEATKLARKLMREHALNSSDTIPKLRWKFKIDRAKRRCGMCFYGKRLITLSKHHILNNDEPQVRDTILHEIAHALVGHAANHGPIWKEKAVQLGCSPNRCADETVEVAKPTVVYACKQCFREVNYYAKLRTRRGCRVCCDKYYNGKFYERAELILVKK